MATHSNTDCGKIQEIKDYAFGGGENIEAETLSCLS